MSAISVELWSDVTSLDEWQWLRMDRCTGFLIASCSLEAGGMISLFMVSRELLPASLLENTSYAAVFSWSCIECEFQNLLWLSLPFMHHHLRTSTTLCSFWFFWVLWVEEFVYWFVADRPIGIPVLELLIASVRKIMKVAFCSLSMLIVFSCCYLFSFWIKKMNMEWEFEIPQCWMS